jgi:glycosyltransferase involved in cell wall biosynthesis
MKRFLITEGVRPNKIKIIHNAIDKREPMPTGDPDEVRNQLGISDTDRVLAVVGRLGPEKG